ncbi:MAG: hypothetical protein GY842_12815, partial [bacterium]|nr:hypothetical protein [bacterium]
MTEITRPAASSYGGTRLYMAPEVMAGKVATLQADVYSLGVVLYQVVVGDLGRFLASGWLRDIDDELLRDDIAVAVDGSPERRLGSVRELAQRLRTIEERRAEREAERRLRESVQRGRRRRKVMAVAMGILVVFALAMGVLAMGVLALRIRDEAERAEQEAARVKNIARVAVGESLVDKDPTRAALALLEVEKPDETPLAVTAIRKVLRHQLATLELRGHKAAVRDVSWSPGGDRIVSASDDGTARIWDIDAMGDPIILPHDESVRTASFGPSGDRIVTVAGKAALVWNIENPRTAGEPRVLNGHQQVVSMASWSPEGDRIVTASHDGTARVWNAAGLGEPIVLEGHQDRVLNAAWSPDGGRIATGSRDGSVRVWDADGRGEQIVIAEIPVHPFVGHSDITPAWSPDGKRVVTVSSESARIWRADGQGEPIIFQGGFSQVKAPWSPDGGRILIASWNTVRISNADGPGYPIVLKGHQDVIWDGSWSPDGKRVVTVSTDRTARVWMIGNSELPW